MSYLNFRAFQQFFFLSEVAYLVTQFDRKLQFFKYSIDHFWHF